VTPGAGGSRAFGVVLFQSINGALYAERLLEAANVPHKLIPVPRRIASDCGVCLRFLLADQSRVEAALAGYQLGITGYTAL